MLIFSTYLILLTLQWYPETWSVGGQPVKYTPNLKGIEPGQYRSGDPVVVKSHVKALDYGRADIAIISCKFFVFLHFWSILVIALSSLYSPHNLLYL